ncbi:MAG: phytanoyl-CoA dioxygenase family protein [Opitutaceae bacterium]|nr:phytanoyl-CoA dioxygenase family protein [Opitutaceae bacterium]
MTTLAKYEIKPHHRLNQDQVDRYMDEGYLVYPEKIFSDEKFERLKAHFEKKLANLPEGARPEAMDVPHFTDPTLFEWLFADEVLDLVEPILGPDISLFSSHFICKPKGDGRKVPWHEDSFYWKGMLEPMEVVTVWLAIDPSVLANGCMHVKPRTHRLGQKGFSNYESVDGTKNVFETEIVNPDREPFEELPCILQPNHASVHDGRLMHGSAANTSDLRRCGYTMRYMSSACSLTPAHREHHQLYLARGRDLAHQPQNYADPTRSHDEFMAARIKKGKLGH